MWLLPVLRLIEHLSLLKALAPTSPLLGTTHVQRKEASYFKKYIFY